MCISITTMMALQTFSQKIKIADGVKKQDLPVVYLSENQSVHFISPEPIQYVDISAKNIIGDLPVKNILRIKYRPDSSKSPGLKDAVLTIIGERFIAQYLIVFFSDTPSPANQTDIEIMPADTRPIDFPGISMSQSEMKIHALGIMIRGHRKHLESSKAYGLKADLNHVYTLGDYIFLDVEFNNKTNLKYDIDGLRFKIEDNKITKATTMQSLEITPDFALFDNVTFKKHYRNIFVFKKFTYPGNKLLQVEMSEKQLSGRIIKLNIPYRDILEADTVPN